MEKFVEEFRVKKARRSNTTGSELNLASSCVNYIQVLNSTSHQDGLTGSKYKTRFCITEQLVLLSKNQQIMRRSAHFTRKFDELLYQRLRRDRRANSAYPQLPMLTRHPSHSPSIRDRGMIRQAQRQSGTVEHNQALTSGSAQSS